MPDRSVYLHDIPLDTAQARLAEALSEYSLAGLLAVEELPLDENLVGRVTAEPVWAQISSPHYHASAMDGFAVRAVETVGAMPTAPIWLELGAQAAYVDTGDPLPDWSNAVVPIENVEALDETGATAVNLRQPAAIRIRAAVPPWSHVRPMGEDIVASQLVLPGGHTIRPVDLGAAAAAGHDTLRVARKPRVAILPTGSELVPIGVAVKPGDIIEYNSVVLAGLVQGWGAQARRHPISIDNFDLILKNVRQAVDESDLVLLNAGSSAGSEDYSAAVIETLGEVLVHGVAVRPGHPVIIGMVKRSTGEGWAPVIGVPGYPVSAALTAEIFVEPLLSQWLGRTSTPVVEVEATLTRKVTSPAGDDDYMRVVAGRVGERLLAAPLSRGAGVITSMVRADGIVILPRGVQGIESGSTVKVRLYRAPSELEKTIFAIGSHDMSLDVLAQYLALRGTRLVSANVGSQGGLVALRRGEAHIAGTHLLDPQTGIYNIAALGQYLQGEKIRLVAWVGRQQGLMIKPQNPKGIRKLEDLLNPDVAFINRQRGSGTRVLLDYQLDQLNIPQEEIKGYEQEEYTHLAVAAAVASGRADCGLGIPAAAKALDLEFIHLFDEEYDLAIPVWAAESKLLEPFFQVIQLPDFRKAVTGLPGYDVSRMGTIVADLG